MATTKTQLIANQWTQITTTDTEGAIRHSSGNCTVVYCESSEAPEDFDSSPAIAESTTLGQTKQYYGVADGEFIFAWPIGKDASLSITPKL